RAGVYRRELDFDARNVTPDEEIAAMAKVPLAFQPGTAWNYSVSTDMLGRVVEKASGKRLADFLDERLFKPLGMKDSGFWVPAAKMPRLAESLEKDRFAGRPFPLIDVSAQPKNDSGGAGGEPATRLLPQAGEAARLPGDHGLRRGAMRESAPPRDLRYRTAPSAFALSCRSTAHWRAPRPCSSGWKSRGRCRCRPRTGREPSRCAAPRSGG